MQDLIMKLSPKDVIILDGLVNVAKEAMEVEKTIHSYFSNSFGIGVDKIEVWSDVCNNEYMTYEGVWQARYLHQTYDVICTAEEIYKIFRAEYLIDNGFVKEYDENCLTEEGQQKQVCQYFRGFVQKIKQTNN